MSTIFRKETAITSRGQTPRESVEAQLKVIDGLEAAHNGLYLLHLGGQYSSPPS